MQNKTIVFDIDSTIATGFEGMSPATLEREYPWVSIFKRNGLYIDAIVPNIIHPGVVELIQYIDKMPNTRMSFFSARDEKIINPLVEKLFCLALGRPRYEAIKDQIIVGSKDDLTGMVESSKQTQLKNYGPMFVGNKKKNLNKVLKPGEDIAWTVLFEDDSSYSYYGQEKNLLKTLGATDLDFDEAFSKPTRSSKLERRGTFANINHIFRLAGVFFEALDIATKDGKTLADALFQIQFKENKEAKDENPRTFDEESYWKMDYYELGLEILRQINPSLCFFNPEAPLMHQTNTTESELTAKEMSCDPWYLDMMFDAIDQKNSVELLTRLKLRGADFNVKNKHGSTLLNNAVLRLPSFNPQVMADLVRGGYTAERNADTMKRSQKYLLESAQTQLDKALTLIDFLLENGASPRISGVNGITPLSLLLQEINLSHIDITVVQVLDRFINHEADVNAVDNEGKTALHEAVRSGNVAAIDYLIKHEAKVDTQCKEGWTPLHYAAEWGHPHATTLLLQNGASPNKTNKDGLTPSQLTAKAIGRDCNRKVKSKYIEVQEIIAEHIRKKQKEEKDELPTSPDRNYENQFQRPQSDSCFIERHSLFDNISTHFSKSRPEILVLNGLRGIGKSYMAKHYFLDPARHYKLRAWFNLGASSENLEIQYLKLASEIGLTPPTDVSTQDKILYIKNWLEKQTNILLIYDDVPDAESLTGFLPESGEHLDIIITTCNQLRWEPCQKFKLFPLPVMEECEAFELINKITRYSDNPSIRQLIKLMNGLPLALAQASYYMNLKAVSAQGYLQRYLQGQSYLLEYKPTEKVTPKYSAHHVSEFGNDFIYEKVNFEHLPLWQTFDSDLETLKRQCSDAWFLLLRVSWLASNPIPEKIIQGLLNLHETPDVLWVDVKAAIMRFGFMQQMDDGRLCMHPLLQDIIRSKQDPEASKLLLANVTKIIKEEASFGTPLACHIERLEQHAGNLKMVQPSTPFVFKFSPLEEKQSSPATLAHSPKTSGSFFNTTIKSKGKLIKKGLERFNLAQEEQAIYEKILSKNVNFKISEREGFVLEGTSSLEFKDKQLLALGLKPGQWETKKVGCLDNFVYIKSWNHCLGFTQQNPADLEVSTLQKTAIAALAAKDYRQAIVHYGELVKEYRNNPQLYTKPNQAIAYFSLGLSHLRLEDWKSAYPLLKQAVELHPDCRLYQMRLKECEDMKNSQDIQMEKEPQFSFG
ncbi:MAG: ankyrin repeat domain-containing protein [Legionella sp.]|nr:ankyrin repeat domain-containing protein [Legionella sp.]